METKGRECWIHKFLTIYLLSVVSEVSIFFMKKLDLNFHLSRDDSEGDYKGTREWKSSNMTIIEELFGGPRQGIGSIYEVFCNGKLIKEIPFSYTGSLKEELEKITL